jgi:hypothetical protein
MTKILLVIPESFEHVDWTYPYGSHWTSEYLAAGTYEVEIRGTWACVRIPSTRLHGQGDFRNQPTGGVWNCMIPAYQVKDGGSVLAKTRTWPREFGAHWKIVEEA